MTCNMDMDKMFLFCQDRLFKHFTRQCVVTLHLSPPIFSSHLLFPYQARPPTVPREPGSPQLHAWANFRTGTLGD